MYFDFFTKIETFTENVFSLCKFICYVCLVNAETGKHTQCHVSSMFMCMCAFLALEIFYNAEGFELIRFKPKVACETGLVQLEVHTRNSSGDVNVYTFITDPSSWRGTASGPIVSDSVYQGESYDARLEQPGRRTHVDIA